MFRWLRWKFGQRSFLIPEEKHLKLRPPNGHTFRGILFGSSEYFTSCNRSETVAGMWWNGPWPAPRSEKPIGVEDHLLGGWIPGEAWDEKFVPPIYHGRSWVYLQYEFPFWFQGDFDKLNHGMMGRNGTVTATWLGWCFFSNIFLNVYPENWEKWSKFDEHIFSDGLKSQTRFDLKWSDHWMNPLIRQRKVYWWMTKWNFKDLNMVDLQFFLRVRIGSGTSVSWPLPLEIPGFGCSKSLGGNPGTMASWKGINVKHVTKKHEDLHPKWGQPKITQDEYIYNIYIYICKAHWLIDS